MCAGSPLKQQKITENFRTPERRKFSVIFCCFSGEPAHIYFGVKSKTWQKVAAQRYYAGHVYHHFLKLLGATEVF